MRGGAAGLVKSEFVKGKESEWEVDVCGDEKEKKKKRASDVMDMRGS